MQTSLEDWELKNLYVFMRGKQMRLEFEKNIWKESNVWKYIYRK